MSTFSTDMTCDPSMMEILTTLPLVSRELLTCLAQINHYSNTTTRRLDDTYYSILEKLSALQSAVASLQEVSNLTSQLQSDFEGEARNLEQDIKGQVDEVGEFEAQQEMVTALEARLKAGKEKSDMLVERLDAVRGSLAGWERKEGEWQASMSSTSSSTVQS